MRLDGGKLLINYCIVNSLAVDHQWHAGIFSAATPNGNRFCIESI